MEINAAENIEDHARGFKLNQNSVCGKYTLRSFKISLFGTHVGEPFYPDFQSVWRDNKSPHSNAIFIEMVGGNEMQNKMFI